MLNIIKNKKAAIVGYLIVLALIIAVSFFLMYYSYGKAKEDLFAKPIGIDQLAIISASQDADIFMLNLNKITDEISKQMLFELELNNSCSYYAGTPIIYCNEQNKIKGREKEIIKESFLKLLNNYFPSLPDYDLYIYSKNDKTIIVGEAKEEKEFNIFLK